MGSIFRNPGPPGRGTEKKRPARIFSPDAAGNSVQRPNGVFVCKSPGSGRAPVDGSVFKGRICAAADRRGNGGCMRTLRIPALPLRKIRDAAEVPDSSGSLWEPRAGTPRFRLAADRKGLTIGPRQYIISAESLEPGKIPFRIPGRPLKKRAGVHLRESEERK